MELLEFDNLKQIYENSDVDKKIELYIDAEDLTGIQFRQLLELFPSEEFYKLELAMQ